MSVAAVVGLAPEPAGVHRILQTGGVSLAFQPIIDLSTGTPTAVEVLARFEGYSSPMDVFRAAEPLGLGAQMEGLVLRRALEERYRVPAGMLLTINITPARLLLDPVHSLLTDADLNGIVLELTEHAMPPPPEDLLPVIRHLRERGALVALDDAGAGYQNLNQVAELRPDWVKIDRKVVTGAATDDVQRASLRMFARVSRRIDAKAVAEGVESAEDLATLREVGIPLAQGYLLGRPRGFVRRLGRT